MNRSKLVQVVMLGIFLLGSALAIPAMATNGVLHDSEPGSVLVFPRFDLREGRTTQIRITDTNDGSEFTNSVYVILDFVCPGVKSTDTPCDELNIKRSFTFHATVVLNLPSDVRPPCDEGFIVAYAVRRSDDKPISYNHLIGSYHLDTTPPAEDTETGERVTYAANAIAIQAVSPDNDVITPDGALTFDGAEHHYVSLATSLSSDFRGASAETPPTTGSELVLLTLDTISGAQNPATLVSINFWNQFETRFSANWEFVCWTRVHLEDIDFSFRTAVLGSTYGSLRITPKSNCPIPGGCPPLTPYDPTILGAIAEFGPEILHIRNLYHDNKAKSTVYYPD